MRNEIVDQIIDKVESCKDESMLDLLLKLLIECGY